MSQSFAHIPGRGFPLPAQGDFRPLVTNLPATLSPPPPAPNEHETIRRVQPDDELLDGRKGRQLLAVYPAVLRDARGNVVVPTSNGYVDLGSGHRLDFDPDTLQGRVTPALSAAILNEFAGSLGDAPLTYTGSDVRIMLEVADVPKIGDTKPRFSKQLLECTTLSVSVHREKAPVRACSYANAKGFARGKRTIAGSMVLTQFTTDVFLRFLQNVLIQEDSSKSEFYSKPDQIPPLNMTILFSNEQGFASYRRLLGVELVTDGTVYSSQDPVSEQTISYYAADFTPLMPLTLSSLYMPQDRKRKRERSVQDLWDTQIRGPFDGSEERNV